MSTRFNSSTRSNIKLSGRILFQVTRFYLQFYGRRCFSTSFKCKCCQKFSGSLQIQAFLTFSHVRNAANAAFLAGSECGHLHFPLLTGCKHRKFQHLCPIKGPTCCSACASHQQAPIAALLAVHRHHAPQFRMSRCWTASNYSRSDASPAADAANSSF